LDNAEWNLSRSSGCGNVLFDCLKEDIVPTKANGMEHMSDTTSLMSKVSYLVVVLALAFAGLPGCGLGGSSEVVVYTALDEDFSAPIFREFTRETGITVLPAYDAESTKTVGLTTRIIEESKRPRCDLFWNNEILNTLRLERQGLLRPYKSPAAAGYPSNARSASGLWYGFAARARVLVVNTNRIGEARRPKSIRDLADPQWGDQCAIAKPLFGTTATHAACLFAAWGDEEAKEFLVDVKRNAKIMAGNKQVAQAVAAGSLAFGLTDTDDAIVEIERGMPVTIVYPDQGEGQVGTLFIPNTLALIADSPNPDASEKLLDYLLSSDAEQLLAEGPSAQIPLRKGVPASPRVKTPAEVRSMKVDWSAAAAKWDAAADFLKTEFTGP
jgi:iron(III) transport system substrate-binding protein